MQIDTLIIGFVPLADTAGKRPREIRDDAYFKDLISSFDLGSVHYADFRNWKEKIDQVNPLAVIVLGGDYYAREVRERKKDVLLYVAEDAGSIFYRKAEMETKKAKNQKIFMEIAGMLQKVRDGGEKELKACRHFASLSYKDLYDMITKALIGEDENLKKQAWDLLWGPGEKHRDIIWMRVQMMAEVWEHSKGKQLEELVLMSMERHLDQGTARKLDNFTDADGQEYHQYMFLGPCGNDLKHIRRIPFASKDQDRYSYENLLEKNEIPTNYLRIQLEANQMREEWDKYLASECEKIKKVLERWKENPKLSKKELGVVPWENYDSNENPMTDREVESLKNFLKKYGES